MPKYNDELKIKVVKEYQEGILGFRRLAKKHHIKSKSLVERWVKIYEKFGEEGIKSNGHKGTYSVQFKLDVLSFIKRTGTSETQTALHFGLDSPTLIASWKKSFREDKAEALDRTRGRGTMSDRPKNKTRKI
ncbi:helix-turn-helix domain-containing protein, partial [Evansella cellulosilytica]|uniref:Transposase, putative n=1 Tax=Evansella cellulosilytica (strain ATCC 21833 / DSM 2522 / FERM P-1141 / JCM 9156 / N-4) TaxID=649639 RepID=E6TUR9_EVAC2